jgi:tetratricopeptide (TPR) repeat protein
LEQRFHDVTEAQPDLLAHHHAAAEQKAQAIGYAQRAAEQALQRSAFAEASAHASNAISWADVLEGSKRAEAELAANGVLSQALMTTRGWADGEVKAAVDRCTALLRKLDKFSPHRVPTLWQLFAFHHTSSDRPGARAVALELVAVAEESGDRGFRAAAATLLGITLHPEGNITEAKSSLKRAIELYDPDLHRDQGHRIGMHPLVLAKTLLAQLHWFGGDAASAKALVADALDWAREVGHVPTIAMGLLYGCLVYQYADEKEQTAAMTAEILAMSQQYGLPAYEAYAGIIQAWALRDEQRAAAILDGLLAMGCKLGLSYYASLVAENLADRGCHEEAIERIDYCLSLCAQNNERYFEPELHRRRAIYQLQGTGSTEGARASLEQAAHLARKQDMPRTEALAIGELLARFGDSGAFQMRLKELLSIHLGLRQLITTTI